MNNQIHANISNETPIIDQTVEQSLESISIKMTYQDGMVLEFKIAKNSISSSSKLNVEIPNSAPIINQTVNQKPGYVRTKTTYEDGMIVELQVSKNDIFVLTNSETTGMEFYTQNNGIPGMRKCED